MRKWLLAATICGLAACRPMAGRLLILDLALSDPMLLEKYLTEIVGGIAKPSCVLDLSTAPPDPRLVEQRLLAPAFAARDGEQGVEPGRQRQAVDQPHQQPAADARDREQRAVGRGLLVERDRLLHGNELSEFLCRIAHVTSLARWRANSISRLGVFCVFLVNTLRMTTRCPLAVT